MNRRGFVNTLCKAFVVVRTTGLIGLTVKMLQKKANAENLVFENSHYLRNANNEAQWFYAHRVQGHIELGRKGIEKKHFFKIASIFRQLGAKIFVRYIKSAGEGAWWPSKVGNIIPEAVTRNIAFEIIQEAHKEQCKIIVYYRHMEDKYMASNNPSWQCRGPDGESIRTKRGIYLCFNSPYLNYLIIRLKELVFLGADGFYFDETHMPKTGCWCNFCREKFHLETGLKHPPKRNVKDPLWHKLVDFNNKTIENGFRKIRDELHTQKPEIVLIISGHHWPAMTDRHLSNQLFRLAHSLKTEFSVPIRVRRDAIFKPHRKMIPFEKDIKLALGYTLSRDAANGNPAHVWIHGVPNKKSSLYAVAGVVTHGCIASLSIDKEQIPDFMFQDAFSLGNKISHYFTNFTSYNFTAIHYSETARDQYATRPQMALKYVIYPVYGAFSILLRKRIPVSFVTDSQLEEGKLEGVKVLFVPCRDGLSLPMIEKIDEFVENGGVVLHNIKNWEWHKSKGCEEAKKQFLSQIEPALAKLQVQVLGGPKKMHVATYVSPDRKSLTISLCNDFSWVHTGRKKPVKKTFEPSKCSGVSCRVSGIGELRSAFDAVSGKELSWIDEGSTTSINLPDFQFMAVLVLKFKEHISFYF